MKYPDYIVTTYENEKATKVLKNVTEISFYNGVIITQKLRIKTPKGGTVTNINVTHFEPEDVKKYSMAFVVEIEKLDREEFL